MIEILLATLENVQGMAGFIIFLGITAIVILAIANVIGDEHHPLMDEKEQERRHELTVKRAKRRFCYLIPFFIILCLPTIDDLWKVRISMIKYHLASPENVTQAAETIERIGKKLECKYIGCDEEKGK